MTKDKLLTSASAAKILGFTSNYIRRLCSSGAIKSEKMGNSWIFTEAAIKNITRKRKVKLKEDTNGNSKFSADTSS